MDGAAGCRDGTVPATMGQEAPASAASASRGAMEGLLAPVAAAAPTALPPGLAALPPGLTGVTGITGLPPGINLAQLMAALAANNASASALGKPAFSLALMLGPVQPGSVTLTQAQQLQRAIVCIRDSALQSSLANLVTMKAVDLQVVLNNNTQFSLRDVIARLQGNLDLTKAQQAFGDGWDYSPAGQASLLAPASAPQGFAGMQAPSALMGPAGMARANALAALQGQLAALGAAGGLANLQTALLLANSRAAGGVAGGGVGPGAQQALLAALASAQRQPSLGARLGSGGVVPVPHKPVPHSRPSITTSGSGAAGPIVSAGRGPGPRVWGRTSRTESGEGQSPLIPQEPDVEQEPQVASPHDSEDEREVAVLGALPLAPPEQLLQANHLSCNVCRNSDHPTTSPMVLCDFCPRAVHLACLGYGPALAGALPPWAQGLPGGPLDFGKLAPSSQWACPKCLDRQGIVPAAPLPPLPLPAPPQGLTSHSSGTASGITSVAAAAGDLAARLTAGSGRLAGQPSDDERARMKAGRQRDGKGFRAGAHIPDDMELQEDEVREGLRLEAALMATLASAGGGAQALARNQQALRQQRLLMEGPLALQPLLRGPEECITFLEAYTISEFSIAFADLLGLVPMSVCEVQHAVCWPLESEGRLGALYCGLLELLISSLQTNSTGTGLVARCKRWKRLLAKSTGDVCAWQELARRYLLACRKNLVLGPRELEPPSLVLLSDELATVHGAVALGRGPYWRIPPTLHLRMLTSLVADAMGCTVMHVAITKRSDAMPDLVKHLAEAEARRDREDFQRFNHSRGRGKARGRGRGAGRGRNGEAWVEGEEEGGDTEGVEEEEEGLTHEAQMERDLRAQGMRSEPLGLDRRHRRYLWVPHGGPPGGGVGPGSLVVHECDAQGGPGGSLALVATPAQLQDLMARLNKKGYREGPLLVALNRLTPRILAGMAQIAAHHQQSSATAPSIGAPNPQQQASKGTAHPAPLRMLGTVVQGRPPPRLVATAAAHCKWSAANGRTSSLSAAAPTGTPTPTLHSPTPFAAYPAAALGAKEEDSEEDNKPARTAGATAQVVSVGTVVKGEDGRGGGRSGPTAARDLRPEVEDEAILGMIQGVAAELEGAAAEFVELGVKQVSVDAWRSWLRGSRTSAGLVSAVTRVEARLAALFDGLPPGADDASLELQVAEVEVYEAEFVLPQTAAQAQAQAAALAAAHTASHKHPHPSHPSHPLAATQPVSQSQTAFQNSTPIQTDPNSQSDTPSQQQTPAQTESQPPDTQPQGQSSTPSVLIGGTSTSAPAQSQQQGESNGDHEMGEAAQDAQPPAAEQDPGLGGGAGKAGGGGSESQTALTQGVRVEVEEAGPPEVSKQVVELTEVDDYDPDREVDRERTWKRNAEEHDRSQNAALLAALAAGEPLPLITPFPRPHFALWRAPAERLTFLRDLRRAGLTRCPASVAFSALLLADRCQMLLRKLRKERAVAASQAAGYSQVEAAMAAAASAAVEKQAAQDALVMSGPRKRKASVAGGDSELIAGILGNAVGGGTQGGALRGGDANGVASSRPGSRRYRGGEETNGGGPPLLSIEQLAQTAATLAAATMWLCAACKGEGEVLMCEVEGCPVLLHPACCGLPGVPEGDWFCPVHAHLAVGACPPAMAAGPGLQGPEEPVENGDDEKTEDQASPPEASRGRGRGRGGASGRGGGQPGASGARGRGRSRGRGRGRRGARSDESGEDTESGGERRRPVKRKASRGKAGSETESE